MLGFAPQNNATPFAAVSKHHWDDAAWAPEAVSAGIARHSMATWAPGNSIKGAPVMVRGEGVYLYDADGKQYVDLTSQAVCANFGHTTPEPIKAAVAKQMEDLAFVYSGLATCEVRARLSSLLAEVCPGDINGFLFPSGGGEANEAAIRMARRYTGRQKIVSHYRSYHGGTTGSLAATGDFRRWGGEAGAAGFVKAFGPTPWHFSFGRTEEEEADKCLAMLEEQVLMEGPHTIAAIMFESIVGAGGVHKHPAHYVQGVRALCDRHGILLILDEVMCGESKVFRRTHLNSHGRGHAAP
jgi:taurine--2-oxoglutarate transaminase